jgi:hypothetical protein
VPTPTAAPTPAPAPAPLPSGLGWHSLANTKLQAYCPPDNFGSSGYAFASNCVNVVEAWSSGVMDTKRNRLIVWGGGHNDYYGNEVYAVNLDSLTAQRLNNPSVPTNLGKSPTDTLADGTPNSRHTYDGITYMENVDKMFVYGGGYAAAAGTLGTDTWLLNMATMQWQKMSPSGPLPRAVPGIVTAYDKNTGKVFIHDDSSLYSYDASTNAYTRLTNGTGIDYHCTAVIDPVRKKFVVIGGGDAWSYDLTTNTRTAINTSGASAVINSGYPGLAYDSVSGRIVAWNGGNTVYSLDLGTNSWTSTTYSGGPGSAPGNGTYKRFAYSPTSGAFVVVNSMNANAFTLRLR